MMMMSVVKLVACVWMFQALVVSVTHAAATTRTPQTIVIDGTNTWNEDQRIASTGGVAWYLTWDSDAFFAAVDSPLVQQDDTEVLLHFSATPQPNPGTGTGIESNGQENVLPFSATHGLHIQLTGGNVSFELSTANPWTVITTNATVVANGTFLEISIPWEDLTSDTVARVYVCGYITTPTTTTGIMPGLDRSGQPNSEGSAAQIRNYLGFAGLPGLMPSYPGLHVNILPVFALESEIQWSTATWVAGVAPTPTSLLIILQDQVVNVNVNTQFNSLFIVSGGSLVIGAVDLTMIGPGLLLSDSTVNNACCASPLGQVLLADNYLIDLQPISFTQVTMQEGSLNAATLVTVTSSLQIQNYLITQDGVIQYGDSTTQLIYNANGAFVAGKEFSTTNNPPSVNIISTNLTIPDDGARTIGGDLAVQADATLDLSSRTSALNIGGSLFLHGTFILSADSNAPINLSGSFSDQGGSLIRSGQDFLCPSFQFDVQNATCLLNNGAVSTIVTESEFEIQYSWSSGQSTPSISNLDDGTYTLSYTETRASGCPTTSYNVTVAREQCSTTGTTGEPATTGTTAVPATTGTTGTPQTTEDDATTGSTTGSTTGILATTGTTAPDNINSPSDSGSDDTTNIIIAVVVGVAGCLLLTLIVVLIVTRSRNKRKPSSPNNNVEKGSTVNDVPMVSLVRTNSDIKHRSGVPDRLTAVKAVGLSFDQNAQYRRTMEDEHVIIDQFGNRSKQGYFAIYDGHGGTDVVEFVASKLHKVIAQELKNCKEYTEQDDETATGSNTDSSSSDREPQQHATIQKAIAKAYATVDASITTQGIGRSGSTSAVAMILNLEDSDAESSSESSDSSSSSDSDSSSSIKMSRFLYASNIGDARTVLCRGDKAIRLSYDHKAIDEQEAKRVKDTGGWIVQEKVAGILSVTRAFGDSELKEWVIPEPYQTKTKLQQDDTFLIVACDGLWDVCTDQQAVDLLLSNKGKTAQELSEMLLRYALENRTRDNVSVIVVIL